MPPNIIADRYHVLRELGRGGMGVVYQVLHTQTSEQYALKVLLAHKAAKGDSVERFKRELKLPARIKSEHVVQVIDSGEVREESDAPFYVMELLRGCDLRKLLDTQHAFTAQEIIWILRQLAQGLSRAHKIGIVHRDLKPDNIFLHRRDDDRLVVKILDFGIARYAQELLETGDQEKLTATQAMLGTPLYMAPEQAKGGEGRSEIGPCTDIWAVGMIVFELLTGKTYWSAKSVVAHLSQLLFAAMVPASQRAKGLPSGFDAWFARSCNRDSGKRYKSVSEQISALASMLAPNALARESPSALLAAVKQQMPPLVDHSEDTMIAGPSQGSETAPREAHKSAVSKNRAQSGSSIAPKTRALLGGVLVLSLGVLVLVITLRKSMSGSDLSKRANDGGAQASGLPVRMDLAAPAVPAAPAAVALSPEPPHPVAVRKHAAAKPERSATPKAAKSHDAPPKTRRTYIPPGL